MRKAELVKQIAKETGINTIDVKIVLDGFAKAIKTSLSHGDTVWIRGFASFGIKQRKAKVGQNVRQGGSIKIPARNVPCFKPAKELFDLIPQDMPFIPHTPAKKAREDERVELRRGSAARGW